MTKGRMREFYQCASCSESRIVYAQLLTLFRTIRTLTSLAHTILCCQIPSVSPSRARLSTRSASLISPSKCGIRSPSVLENVLTPFSCSLLGQPPQTARRTVRSLWCSQRQNPDYFFCRGQDGQDAVVRRAQGNDGGQRTRRGCRRSDRGICPAERLVVCASVVGQNSRQRTAGGAELVDRLRQDEKLLSNASAKQGIEEMGLLFRYLDIFGVSARVSVLQIARTPVVLTLSRPTDVFRPFPCSRLGLLYRCHL